MPTLIVFLPGFTSLPHRSNLNPLLWRLSKDYDVTTLPYTKLGIGDITDTAKELKAIDDTKYDNIVLLGHSMGGLVARKLAILLPELADKLRIITLGTPHRGCRLVPNFGWLPHSITQMAPGSKFLTYGLKTQNKPPPAITVNGGWDLLVTESESSWDGAQKNIVVPRITHLGLLLSYRVYAEIYSWLKYDQKVF